MSPGLNIASKWPFRGYFWPKVQYFSFLQYLRWYGCDKPILLITGGEKKKKHHRGQLWLGTYLTTRWCNLTQGSMGLRMTEGWP